MKTIMYSLGVDCESEPDSEVLILDIFYTHPLDLFAKVMSDAKDHATSAEPTRPAKTINPVFYHDISHCEGS